MLSVSFSANANMIKDKGWPIITRKGDQLYEGDRIFRFLGFAAPNIQQNESQLSFDFIA
ncbi:hypothetical protein JCM21142_72812 [Saccharicrinis fermentans DSM 9555 = JCM 21142]|uniref:Uncharacterized protein n=1 Tax=Saccharicrinis fermentans DSM 9555 = JCM 21142 TaxID=869213 RepID=W7Y795_9BACT|nr:hypothetical protein JCM21142_72812 [Saccharicrinis fermentans DSM 9555 = JCM 21142]